jgi:membrane-bound inhibitor of C-type lysozyme
MPIKKSIMKMKHAGKGFNSLKDCPFDHQITTLAQVIFFSGAKYAANTYDHNYQ